MYHTLIAPAELSGHLNSPDWVIIDCRFSALDPPAGRRAYMELHIPGAHYADLDRDLASPHQPGITGRHPLPKVADFAAVLSRWGIDETVQVVVYDDNIGGIAARLWWMLRWMGHEAVAVLDGGWKSWCNHNLPVTADPPPQQTRIFTPRLKPALLAPLQDIERQEENAALLLVDSRAMERYTGQVEPLDPVAGHIPGALCMPYTDNAAAGKLLSPEALQQRFDSKLHGESADDVIFYCGSGVTACHNILAYKHAGLGDARLYVGSWSEWIAGGKRAVATGDE